MNKKQKNILTLWLLLGMLTVAIIVLVGGITRLTNSGLSMVEWNLISGSIPPMNENEWEIAFDKYKQFPEYKKINQDMLLEEFKMITGIKNDDLDFIKSYCLKEALPEKIINLEPHKNIYYCGDWNQEPSIDGALKSGRLLAENLNNCL